MAKIKAIAGRSKSNGMTPILSEPARNRVLYVLALHDFFWSVRELATTARVAPSTALRIVNELHRRRILLVGRQSHSPPATRVIRLRPDERAALRRSFGIAQPYLGDPLEWIRGLNAPIWIVGAQDLRSQGVITPVPPFLITNRRWARELRHLRARQLRDVPLEIVVFDHIGTLRRSGGVVPPIELLMVLLRLNTTAARSLHIRLVAAGHDRRTLLRRIREERLGTQAAAAAIPPDLRPLNSGRPRSS